VEYDLRRRFPERAFSPSRLFLYYNTRRRMGTVESPSGENVGDTLGAAKAEGLCPESMWPYDVERVTESPPDECYTAAAEWSIRSRKVAHTAERLRATLAAGNPVVISFYVYDSMMSDAVAKTGRVPMPSPNETIRGGHAALIVGYDDAAQVFIVRNSWGMGLGDNGYCYLPYAFVLDRRQAFEFHSVRAVHRQPPPRNAYRDLLARYRQYFASLGFEDPNPPVVDVVEETPGGTFGYYDAGANRIVVSARVAEDPDVLLRQYSHHVLYASGPMLGNTQPSRTLQAIESGLANYFVFSFNNESRFGRTALRITGARERDWDLSNERSFSELSSGFPNPLIDGTIWGGAFWELRRLRGEVQADFLLYSGWRASSAEDVESPEGFVRVLLELARPSNMASDVEKIFESRGVGRER